MIVNSAALDKARDTLNFEGKPRALANGVVVSAAQCETAARILREAEPSIITSASGPVRVTLNEPQERPGFIDSERQTDPEVLVFDVGILPTDTYHINRKGEVIDP